MQILRSTLRAMRHLAGQKDVRYYLNGVHVEIVNGFGILAATDGSLMGAHAFPVDADEPNAEFTIPFEAIKGLKANGSPSVEITHAAGKITISADGITQTVQACDGKFPDWRRVMPEKASGEFAHFNPDLAARFAEVARELFGRTTKQCPLVWPNGTGAGLVNFDGYTEFRGALMPRSYKAGEEPSYAPFLPHWASREPLRTAA